VKNLPGAFSLDPQRVQELLVRRLDLSPREADVLLGVTRGWSNKAIASDLGISLFTVKTHLKKVFKQLQVHTRTAAAGVAFAALAQRQ